jgi:hypothetical protein
MPPRSCQVEAPGCQGVVAPKTVLSRHRLGPLGCVDVASKLNQMHQEGYVALRRRGAGPSIQTVLDLVSIKATRHRMHLGILPVTAA